MSICKKVNANENDHQNNGLSGCAEMNFIACYVWICCIGKCFCCFRKKSNKAIFIIEEKKTMENL